MLSGFSADTSRPLSVPSHLIQGEAQRKPRAVKGSEKESSSLSPDIQKQITKAVQIATRKFCTNKGQICVQGPPGTSGPQRPQGSVGPPGRQKGDPGEPTPSVPTSLQPFKRQQGSIIKAPEIVVKPAAETVILNETATFQCTAGKNVDAKIAWSKEASLLPAGRHSIIQGTLYIKNVIVSDNGIYVCTVTTTNQGTAQAAVTLNVKGKNKI